MSVIVIPKEIVLLIDEVVEFLKKLRYETEFSRCNIPQHYGLTYRCIWRRPDAICITCLGCEIEAAIYGCGGESGVCGICLFTKDGKPLPGSTTYVVFDKIPELQNDLKTQLIDYIRKISEISAKDLSYTAREILIHYFRSKLMTHDIKR